MRRVLTLTFLTDSHGSFLTSRPEWTLEGALLKSGESTLAVEQPPFRWTDGLWEAEAVVNGTNHNKTPTRVVLRVSPETLRRWKDLEINPFLEACAQLEEYLRIQTRHGHLTALVLL